MDDWTEPVLRLAAAVVVGSLIGVNRDLYGKPTGVRLHSLVCVGSALFVMLAGQYGRGGFDPAAASRIVQGIVGGIGFLGAGVILRTTVGDRVQHITTAATIWVTAALGTACGLGAWLLAWTGSLLVLLILTLGFVIDKKLYRRAGGDDSDGPP